MGSPLALGRVPQSLFLYELLSLFRFPSVSGRALLAGTPPFGIVLLVLLARLPLGGCQILVVLWIWFLLIMMMEERFLLVMFARRFAGFVVLVRDGKEFDSTEKTLHTLRVWRFNLGHAFGRDCILAFLFLIERGDGAIRMIRSMFPLRSGLGGLVPWVCACPRLQACMFCN